MRKANNIGLFVIVIGVCILLVILMMGQEEKEELSESITFKEKQEESVELVWYFIGNGQQLDRSLVEQEVNKYIKDKINATVKLECFGWGTYDQTIRTIIESGEKFDICFTSNWTNSYFEQAAKGAFVPLNDYFDNRLSNTIAILGMDFLSGSQINGISYALPANKEKAHQWGFLIRKDLMDKYSIDISEISTLEELEPALSIIKENEQDVYPLLAINGDSPFKLLDFEHLGDDNYPGILQNNTTGFKVVNEFELEETLELFRTMHRYYESGYIRKDSSSVSDFTEDVESGKVFAFVQSLKPGKDIEMSNSTGYEWVQKEITEPIISNRDTTGSMQAISVTSEHPEVAAEFLELFNTDVYLNNLINFGIEDVHYIKVDNTVMEQTKNVERYNPSIGWVLGNQLINYTLVNENKDKWADFEAFNDEAKTSKALGFVFDPKAVEKEISRCKEVWQEYIPILETGTVDPDIYLPIVLQTFREAGINAIIEEKQRQLDEWRSSRGPK